MEKYRERIRASSEKGRRKAGVKIGEDVFFVEDIIQDMALDIAESYGKIDRGEKKREETNIDLQMQVLNSLSNALKSLGTVLYY